jgi:hypothetical protein
MVPRPSRQAKSEEASTLLAPSQTSLYMALCTRLDLTLDHADLNLTKRLISLAMDCFANKALMLVASELEVRLLMLQLLDRLVDRRLVDFGDSHASYLLKTINLLMLRLLQNAPRHASLAATLACLAAKLRKPSDRQIADLLLKCLWKLVKLVKHEADAGSQHTGLSTH